MSFWWVKVHTSILVGKKAQEQVSTEKIGTFLAGIGIGILKKGGKALSDRNWKTNRKNSKKGPESRIRRNSGRILPEFPTKMLDSYGIISKLTMVKNPSTNAIVKRIHGTLGSNSRPRFLEPIGATTSTRSFKCVLMHFVQANLLSGITARIWIQRDLSAESADQLGAHQSTPCSIRSGKQRKRK
jgi:hypothetical protein